MNPKTPQSTLITARNTLENCLKARQPGIHLRTLEEERAITILRSAVHGGQNRSLCRWSMASGLWQLGPAEQDATVRDTQIQKDAGLEDAITKWIEDQKWQVLALLDPWPALEAPVFQRLLREAFTIARSSGKTIVLVGKDWPVPVELQDDLHIIDLVLPNNGELLEFITKFTETMKDKMKDSDGKSKITVDQKYLKPMSRACQGLTIEETRSIVGLSIVQYKAIGPEAVALSLEAKKQIVKRGGVLKYEETNKTMDDIGGLETLKEWLGVRSKLFSDEARAAGIKPPKGVLLVGVWGCGKSLSAKAIASAWGQPLLTLDAGTLFGSLVGESEGKLRQAIATAEAVAPCVLMIDEIEKGFKQDGGHDGGTSSRVFATLLSWMNDNKGVFIVATCNDINKLDPAMIRRGRFDEIFFVDLPDHESRKDIFNIHLGNSKLPAGSDLLLADATQGFSGSEIEATVEDARNNAFAAGKDLSVKYLMAAIKRVVPMSKIRSSDIEALRELCKSGRARPAGKTIEADAPTSAPTVEV